MKGQRIILTVTNDLTHDRRMIRICNTLAEAESDVLLVGRLLKNSQPLQAEKFRRKRLNCFFTKGPFFYIEYNIRLFFFLLFSSFDIACACDLDTALPVRVAAGMKGKLTVYDAHEYFTEVPELQGRGFIKFIWSLIGTLTIPGFDLRYTVGEELAEILSKKYNCEFFVIRNIPSIHQLKREIRNDINQERKIILYQGALNVGRGLEATVLAMELLPHYEFWLAGEGDITDKLKSIVKLKGLEERVKFLGWVFNDDLPPLMSKAYLGINLREKASLNDYYSLPNKFFDFIHAGLPSINMNYPEYARICLQYPCAFLIDKVESNEIANAILAIEQNPQMYERMQKACEAAKLEFTWVHEGNKLIALYNQLIIGDTVTST